jgi:hypothetical protein|tara:strand:+ start:266 stop:496 length:231 start_codon:yes stop_codon:yes gene_type:complete
MSKGIDITELPKEVKDLIKQKAREQGVSTRKSPTYSFKKDDVRTHALKSMGVLATLSQTERGRVIAHMAKLNDLNL